MKKYQAYKDSGIEWMGAIPKDWKNVRMRYLCEISTGDKDTINREVDGEYPFYVRSKNIEKISTYSYDEEAILTPGDGEICKIWHYVNGKFECHQRVYKLSQFQDVNGRYLYYYLMSNFEKEVFKLSAKSTVDSLRRPMFLNFNVSFGTLGEQIKIADFLDKKTSEIENLINKKKQLITLLKEERTAIINQAVTKGINPNVKFKDSGVEWIGEIPERWEVKKLKYLVKNKLMYGANESAEFDDLNYPRYIRITDFGNDGKLKSDTFKSLPDEIAKDYLLENGDILFARSGATVGKTFLFNNYAGKACFAGYLIKATFDKNKINSKFINYFTRTTIYDNWKESMFQQATIQNIGADKYNQLRIPLPININEQKEIINYIETKTDEIDIIISKTEKEIELMKEYKTALISEAVTGKIDVREEVLS